jgi:hypothetical protein
MKYLVFALALLSIILTAQQPEPLVQKDIKIQPIVENLEMGEKYWYVQTIKIYYKDTIGFKPISFKRGDPLTSRCTDSTLITFLSKGESLSTYSIRRLSCEIIAYFNLNSYEVRWLKTHLVDKIIIRNIVTDNSYIVYINDTDYLYEVLNKYNSINHN